MRDIVSIVNGISVRAFVELDLKKGVLTDIFSDYMLGVNDLEKTRIECFSRFNKLPKSRFIPRNYALRITPFNTKKMAIKETINVPVARIWYDSRDKKPLNEDASEYLLCHLYNLSTQIEKFNPILYYSDLKSPKKQERFDFNRVSVRINNVIQEFKDGGFWGQSYIIIGDKLGEL